MPFRLGHLVLASARVSITDGEITVVRVGVFAIHHIAADAHPFQALIARGTQAPVAFSGAISIFVSAAAFRIA